METVGNDRRDFARAIYERNIYQWRLIETRRTTFFLVYLLLSLSFVMWRGVALFEFSNWPALLFLFAVAKVGYLHAMHAYVEISAHRDAADYILDRYGLHHYWPGVKTPFILRLMPVDKLYLVFYQFAFSFFVLAIIIAVWRNIIVAAIVAILFFLFGFSIAMFYRPKPMKRER